MVLLVNDTNVEVNMASLMTQNLTMPRDEASGFGVILRSLV